MFAIRQALSIPDTWWPVTALIVGDDDTACVAYVQIAATTPEVQLTLPEWCAGVFITQTGGFPFPLTGADFLTPREGRLVIKVQVRPADAGFLRFPLQATWWEDGCYDACQYDFPAYDGYRDGQALNTYLEIQNLMAAAPSAGTGLIVPWVTT